MDDEALNGSRHVQLLYGGEGNTSCGIRNIEGMFWIGGRGEALSSDG